MTSELEAVKEVLTRSVHAEHCRAFREEARTFRFQHPITECDCPAGDAVKRLVEAVELRAVAALRVRGESDG